MEQSVLPWDLWINLIHQSQVLSFLPSHCFPRLSFFCPFISLPKQNSFSLSSLSGALEVTFTNTFTGIPNYYVMAVDYQSYVLIGGPCRLYMWILSRNATRMDDVTWNYLVDVAVSEGFEPKLIGFERDELTGCPVS